MKNKLLTTILVLIGLGSVVLSGCKKDKINTDRKTSYQLKVKDQLGISGIITFTETSASITTIEIALTGGSSQNHPAQIHLNSMIEKGQTSITLNPVVGGNSTTIVTALDNGTAIDYSQLVLFDGYLNIDESSSNSLVKVAQCDIGGNALTTFKTTYNLNTVGLSGVSGTAVFERRNNGYTLVSIALNGTLNSGTHPAAIHIGSVATVGGGPITKSLNDVDGTTGTSYTNIRALDDATPITYDNLMAYDGYLAIHESAILMTSIICQGNIGAH
jgi:hypothetical protein